MNEILKNCPDCLAYYTGEHTCPEWLKALVKKGGQFSPKECPNCKKPLVRQERTTHTWKPTCKCMGEDILISIMITNPN